MNETDMKKWFVYHIKDPRNPSIEKGYVGVTVNVDRRFIDHVNAESIVGHAIRAHQLSISDVEIVATFTTSDEAYALEAKLRPDWRIGWNVTPGGEGYQSDKPADVYTRAKMSLNRRGKTVPSQSPEHYKKLSDSQRDKPRLKVQCPFCFKIGGEGNMQRWHFGKCKKAPEIKREINGYDCDGVITLGLRPDDGDVIITGRSFEESKETYEYLHGRGIKNTVYFSHMKFDNKTRERSGIHKGETIWRLFQEGTVIKAFFEDDWDQYRIIKSYINGFALPTKLIWINHGGLVSLENHRHHDNLPPWEQK